MGGSHADKHANIKPMVARRIDLHAPGLAPTKSRLTLRIWRFPVSASEKHSYIAGTYELGGLSSRLSTVIPFEPERTTLARLRVPIEVMNDNGMNRRTSLFQELLSVMLELPNPHGWPAAVALTYRFGVWPDESYDVVHSSVKPKVIPHDNEIDLVSKWIPRPLEQDLILIPQAQIDPQDVCTLISAANEDNGENVTRPHSPARQWTSSGGLPSSGCSDVAFSSKQVLLR